MRNGHLAVLIGTLAAAVFGGAAISRAMSNPIGTPIALGPKALEVEMQKNPEIALLVDRRGYPDWVERIEVDAALPLDPHEIHLYYLRLDREFAFTRATILGRPEVGIRQFERPLQPEMRARIEAIYLAHDPARRAQLAAEHAEAAAEQAERTAAVVTDSADHTEHIAARAQGSAHTRIGATNTHRN